MFGGHVAVYFARCRRRTAGKICDSTRLPWAGSSASQPGKQPDKVNGNSEVRISGLRNASSKVTPMVGTVGYIGLVRSSRSRNWRAPVMVAECLFVQGSLSRTASGSVWFMGIERQQSSSPQRGESLRPIASPY